MVGAAGQRDAQFKIGKHPRNQKCIKTTIPNNRERSNSTIIAFSKEAEHIHSASCNVLVSKGDLVDSNYSMSSDKCDYSSFNAGLQLYEHRHQ